MLSCLTALLLLFFMCARSGSSWAGVLQSQEGSLNFPADLYLEGSDQHRGGLKQQQQLGQVQGRKWGAQCVPSTFM